ncbi:hypothetical protein IHQ56_08420 [Methylobacillus flagellatus]|uniref:hypothetical protein n=1 Tax=Methylobacillus flagellatus TaxID=405 RepID=UPI002853E578|nr:hypothetical protein [Methylobacillus flagellatus]MDR5171837.1 hypothetical protein [Methylobacillus flagellatus]
MAKDSSNRQSQLRQLIAQLAARMMAEEGISDYAHAKRKAGRQLGVTDSQCMPTNSEIEEEIRVYHEIYNSDDQPEALLQLRKDALLVMQLLERFNPHLTGAVLDGTAGKYAETHIHLFADSLKEVEIFLLNQQIPYATDEKSYRISERRSMERKKVPVFTLEGPHGLIRLSVFEVDDMRMPTKSPVNGSNASRANIEALASLIQQSEPLS